MPKNANDPRRSRPLPAASGAAKRTRSRSLALKPWQAYVFAVAATCVTLAVRMAYEEVLGGPGSLLIFMLPIILSAYVGGLRAGLLATGACYLLSSYYLLSPLHSLEVASPADRWRQSLFVVTGVLISVLNEALHRARRSADAAVQAHHRAEDALFQSSALQSAIFNSANFSSIATDAKGVIQIFNVGAEHMLGYAAIEVVNRITPADISDPQEIVARAQALSIELETPIAPGFDALVFKASRGIEDIYELTYIRKDGSRFPALVSITALRDAQGDIIGYLLIGTDNTARKQVEAQLRQSDERIAIATEAAGIGIWECDVVNKSLTWDNRMYQIYGIPRANGSELYALWASSLHPDDRKRCEDEIAAALLGVKEFDIEYRIVRPTGEVLYVKAAARTFKAPNGDVTRLTGINFDITERKRAEEEQFKAGALQRAIFDSANFSSIATDAKGVIQIFNVGAERMMGYSAAEVVDRITPADLHDPQEVIARAKALSAELGVAIAPGFEALAFKASRGIEDIYELTKVRKDGSRFPAVVSVTALRDAHEGIIGYLLIGTDNTARKEIEEERAKLDQRLRDQHFYTRSLIESNVDALMTIDPRGIVTDVNKQAEALTGCTRDELIGSPFKNCFTDPQRAEAGIKRVLDEGKVTNYELTARARDGKLTVVSYNATTYHDRNRSLQGVVAAARDITERRHYEESLRDATHRAEQASRAKSEFLANMSHEIRTPMNAVIGLAFLLGKTPLNDEQADLLAKLKLGSKSLLLVLNNVLDLSKIEAGELIVERRAFDLRSLLAELPEVLAVQAQAKGIAFEIDCAGDLPEALEGDAARLNQILTNLLSNAIKFTERGGVSLRVRRVEAPSSHVTLRFAVQDTGIGIAPAVQEQLFAPFAQADASITRRFGGTGLGLSIVKRLVNLMGGEVHLDSTPGLGSEFSVTLQFPLASLEALDRPETGSIEPGEYVLPGVRVLLVDDSDINLEVTRRILESEGAQVRIASNGQQAVDLLEAEPDAVDIVLMDVQMPVLDGYDATRRIRSELLLEDLPIIALTAGALSSDRQRSSEAGMDDYIIKPFDAQQLMRSVLRHVHLPAGLHAHKPVDAQGAPAQPHAPWPEIDGIDSKDARERLNNDFELFRSMLKRLLGEFADVALPERASDAGTIATHAGRMHKLRGSAGLLGAKAIQRLAGEAEAACVGGDVALAGPLAEDLASELHRLRQSAEPAFQSRQAPAEDVLVQGGGPLEMDALAELVGLLRQQKLSAMDCFKTLSPQLRGHLNRDEYERVQEHLDNLRFGDAADILEAERG
jgi:PAS domain S-box-containing protein